MTTMQSQQQQQQQQQLSSVLNRSNSSMSDDDDDSFCSYSDAVISNLLTKLCVCMDDDSDNGIVPTEQLYDVECILFELYKYCNPFIIMNNNDTIPADECQLALINANGHTDIITAMNQCMKSSISIQQVGCRLLTASICGLQTDLKQVIITSNNYCVLNVIIVLLNEYPYDTLVQSSACQFIANIVDVLHKDSTMKERFNRNITTISISNNNNNNCIIDTVDSFDTIILNNMQRFLSSQEMQYIGCLYFVNLSTVLQKQFCSKRIETLNTLKTQLEQVMKRYPDNNRLQSFCHTTLQSITAI